MKENKEKLLNLLKEYPNLQIMFFANTEDNRILDFTTTVYEDFSCDIEEVYDCEEKGYFTDIEDVIEMLQETFGDDEKYKDLSDEDFEKEIKKYINKNITHFKAIVIDIY